MTWGTNETANTLGTAHGSVSLEDRPLKPLSDNIVTGLELVI